MSFDSINFLVFFPIVAIIYYIFPTKSKVNIRNIWLLLASYYFYMSWNPKYLILIIISTVITYICGILNSTINNKDYCDEKKILLKKICLTASFIINLAILFFFKYSNFILHNISAVVNRLHIQWQEPYFDFLLPVGISFYTFQALGYTMDVYRGDIKAEKNFIQYALFVSFFPQLVAGPIERSGNLLLQLREEHRYSFDNVREGLLIMLWGFFMKLVIADRVATFVDTVYDNFEQYTGWYLIVATILFGIQIYCDFNGYTMIARGAAKIMGFELMENFDAPYLAETVSDFWRRWHISLTSWFKDYLYIPLGGNRKGKIRKYINIIIVFGVSGLWHGANWTFIVWGLLNGIYQVIGNILKPIRDKTVLFLKLNRENFCHRLASVIVTFAFVDYAWMFFRAKTLSDSIRITYRMLSARNIWILMDHSSLFECGLDRYDFGILLIAFLVLLCADILKSRRISIMKDIIFKQDTWFRWMVYIVSFIFVLVFGVWGCDYSNNAFIYFQF